MRGLGTHGSASASVTAACACSAAAARAAGSGPAGAALQLRQFALDRGEFAGEAIEALAVVAHRAFELITLCGEVGECSGQFTERLFRCRKHFTDRGNALLGAHAALGIRLRLAAQRLFLGGKAGERGFGVGCELALTLDVGVELDKPAVELGHALAGARFLAIERLARAIEPLQRGGCRSLRFAQRRQPGRDDRLACGSFRLCAGAIRDHPDRGVLGLLSLGLFGVRRHPAQMEQRRLGLADLRGDVAVTYGLLGGLLQRFDLRRELVDDVFQPGQVGLGRAQPQFRLVSAGVQAGNAGGLFQHTAALLRLRLDDLADAALVHQRRRA